MRPAAILFWLACGVLTLPRGAALHGPDSRNLCKDAGALSANAIGAAGTLSCEELEAKCQGEGLVHELKCGADIDKICCGSTGLSSDCGTFQQASCSTQQAASPGSASASPKLRCGHGGFESKCADCTSSEALRCNSQDCAWNPNSTPKCQRAAPKVDQEEQGPDTAAIGGGVGGAVAVILIAVCVCWLKPWGAPKRDFRAPEPPMQMMPPAPPMLSPGMPPPAGGMPQPMPSSMKPPEPQPPTLAPSAPPMCTECRGRPGGCNFCAPIPPPYVPPVAQPLREESSVNSCTICLTNEVRTRSTYAHIHALENM